MGWTACRSPAHSTLTAARERRSQWEQLIRGSLRRRADTPTGVRLTFGADGDVKERLERLVALERECCAFARWTITHEHDELVLQVNADADGGATIQELFAP